MRRCGREAGASSVLSSGSHERATHQRHIPSIAKLFRQISQHEAATNHTFPEVARRRGAVAPQEPCSRSDWSRAVISLSVVVQRAVEDRGGARCRHELGRTAVEYAVAHRSCAQVQEQRSRSDHDTDDAE